MSDRRFPSRVPIRSAAVLAASALLAGCTSVPASDHVADGTWWYDVPVPGDAAAPAAADAPRRSSAARPTAATVTPISMREFELLKRSALFGEDDVAALRASRSVLEPHLEELLDVWYGFVGANPHLLASFSNARTGEPDPRYLARVRERFGQWVLDTADAEFDEAWLARQLELGRRHHRVGKNRTDRADAAPHIAFRHVVALQHPVTATMRPFLERGDASPAEVERMHEAWRKAVLLTVILWSQPYVTPADF